MGTKGALSGLLHAGSVSVVTGKASGRADTEGIEWLVLEKRSNELNAYIRWWLDDATLETLVEYAHLRGTIEQFHKGAKQILGLDRFEGRTSR